MPPRWCRRSATCSRRTRSPRTTIGRRRTQNRRRARKAASRLLKRFVVAAALVCVALAAQGQGVTRIVVPFSAGGVQDILARAISAELRAELGTQLGRNVIVETRPGAGNTIGTGSVLDDHVSA